MTQPADPPCDSLIAVARAAAMVGKGGQYLLGTGDYHPGLEDTPWTQQGGSADWGSDCAGFAISWAWKLRRHRPGFNVGPWATVADDINSDSALEDSLHKKELFTWVAQPQPGDLLIYPSIHLGGKRFIGHVGLVEVAPAAWDPRAPNYSLLTIIQCHGPNHSRPGVVRTDGSIWAHHDSIWPKPEHRTSIVRPRSRP